MNAVDAMSAIALFLTALFAFLWYVTPPDHRYRTVEMDLVRTRTMFLVLGMASFAAWLALSYYL